MVLKAFFVWENPWNYLASGSQDLDQNIKPCALVSPIGQLGLSCLPQ